MHKSIGAAMLAALCFASLTPMAHAAVRDIYPDTWVAADALGRSMPSYQQVGPVKKDQRRVVGIFYITWHGDNANRPFEYTSDISRLYKEHPEARLNGNDPAWKDSGYHWGKPEMGYFLSKDKYVIRKDISMLSDAGVDVLIMDVTNAVRYWDEWDVLFTEMQKMKAEGNKVPQFCFWAFNGPCITVVQDLYERIYKQSKYKDLWFYWDGKPLILYNGNPTLDSTGDNIKNPNLYYDEKAKTDPQNAHYGDPKYTTEFLTDYPQEIKDYFTTRTMWWGFYKWGGKRFVGTEDNWSFGYDLGDPDVVKLTPKQLVSKHNGKVEEAAVTPGQHSHVLIGKSWTREHGEPQLNDQDLPVEAYVPWLKKTVKNPQGYGIYFQQRWDEALQVNPQFIYINDWNEWSAGRINANVEFMRRKSNFYFVDQYNAEFNRAIQPMSGGYTDNYYMQMAQNIRKYKGIRPIPVIKGLSNIKIDGSFVDWQKSSVEYRDTIGDVIHRNYMGYGKPDYVNNSGRNDITTSKVAVNAQNVNFFVQTASPLTSSTGKNWMLLLIDADMNPKTGWCGYDYLINRSVVNGQSTNIMKYKNGSWITIGQLPYRYSGNKLELAVPRKLLGLTNKAFSFDFKWADNPADLKDAISLCVNGDTAPNRRFNYRCIWKQ